MNYGIFVSNLTRRPLKISKSTPPGDKARRIIRRAKNYAPGNVKKIPDIFFQKPLQSVKKCVIIDTAIYPRAKFIIGECQ